MTNSTRMPSIIISNPLSIYRKAQLTLTGLINILIHLLWSNIPAKYRSKGQSGPELNTKNIPTVISIFPNAHLYTTNYDHAYRHFAIDARFRFLNINCAL